MSDLMPWVDAMSDAFDRVREAINGEYERMENRLREEIERS